MKKCVFVFIVFFTFFSIPHRFVNAQDFTCDNSAWEYSQYSAACVPKTCPQDTHYSYTGTSCICDNEALKECLDPVTNITSMCIAENEVCPGDAALSSSSSESAEEIVEASVAEISGDVLYIKSGSDVELPLTKDSVIHEGDTIVTGFDSEVLLSFGEFTQVRIYQTSSVRIDQFFNQDNIDKTKLYLNIGSIAGKVRHTPSIRADFSVSTFNASSSIRNSEMLVTYNAIDTISTVYAIEDAAYVQVNKEESETTVAEGKKIIVQESSDSPIIESFTTEDLPEATLEWKNWVGVLDTVDPAREFGNALWVGISICCVAMICLVGVAGILLLVIRKKRTNSN